ncbi:MAG TPA: glycosyltransferase family 2 protein [Solirubrobacteraceae bacterium]|nr:glycosyltransferase family 2 protein [Solirubrobacteraceae bacterium]
MTGVRTAPAAPAQRRVRGFVSIVVPCRNEELTIGEFVDWCWQGLQAAGAEGEVIIVDNSTDRSPEIAREHGARVIHEAERGLGRAYVAAVPHIRGDYVVMGDCDLTYDFRELGGFLQALDDGAEFVMGTRLKGSIEPGAMPRLHRYFGTPVTTWILNRLYRQRFSDIHCGMRAMTIAALRRIDIQSPGWEYASEMVLKAAKLRLRTTEVPVRFLRDREGRESHHRRAGWRSPWKAGWDNLKVMFLYAPEALLLVPGLLLLVPGLVLSAALVGGPIDVGRFSLSLNWSLLGLAAATIGYTLVWLSVLARVHTDLDPAYTDRKLRRWSFDRGASAAFLLAAAGVVLNAILVATWISQGFALGEIYHPVVFGLLLVVLGFQTFAFTLLLTIVAPKRA